jgi:hypothetical protein
LARLIKRLTPTVVLQGSGTALTPLHERVWAQSLGYRCEDGLVPWAALDAQRLGLTALHGVTGWAWITPCHWAIQSNHIDMADPRQLNLTTKEAEALWLAMQPYFSQDGITLFAQALEHAGPRWLAHGAVFDDLPTASLERVAGQTVDRWMPHQEQAKALRRLQNEMQMLLYTHPVNNLRSNFKLEPVNSFWVSGTGSLPGITLDVAASEACSLRDNLSAPALHDDASAWRQAWTALDRGSLSLAADQLMAGEPQQITLCGENRAVMLHLHPLTLLNRLQRSLAPESPQSLLGTL